MAKLKGEREFTRTYNTAMRNMGRLDASPSARMLETTAKQFAPVRTGRLRSSIRVRARASGAAMVYVGAPYGWYVENGTRYMRPRRYMQRALDARRADMVNGFAEQAQHELDKIRGA